MAERLPTGPRAADAVEVSCIQPGGGLCFGLALAWGRWRRRWLRALRPRYVARMAALRQGHCEGCRHDIVDERDLVPWRNVCGYSFPGADQRLRQRGRLGIARPGVAETAVASVVAAIAIGALTAAALLGELPALWLGVGAVAVLWYQAVRFFRDPERAIPTEPDALLSPTDGVVTHIHEVDDPDFPGGRALRLSIYLSPWDVHLNRIPRAGRVVAVRYFPGSFLNARHEQCAVRNEQLWVDLEEPGGRTLRIKQISGAMARRLVCWLRPGEQVRAGERYGMIKYGSRGDVLLPVDAAAEVAVAVGDRVYAGSTVLLRFATKE